MTNDTDNCMPAVEPWDSYLDAAGILRALGFSRWSGEVVEFGCGYGTFTISAARRMAGTVNALDMDPLMVAATKRRVARLGLKNVVVEQRDCVAAGCGRGPQSAGSALLFNFLHIEDPVALFKEARRVLRRGGLVGHPLELRRPNSTGTMSLVGRSSRSPLGQGCRIAAGFALALGDGAREAVSWFRLDRINELC